MPRRGSRRKREIIPDRRYGSVLATKFIRNIMREGKKSLAERVFYDAIGYIEEKTGSDGMTVFNKAVANVRPSLEVRSRRVGGSTYQVPVEVRPERRDACAIRWILQFARKRKGRPMYQKLAEELIEASRGEGSGSVKKKEDTHKMAEANKAFAHYRW
ncbi:30S ribosomal protein S7 [Candidatus Fermentibacterales bacterium]|nr:30S ribosomal protein S7 [Candidatus Fermentibacterales bacterium]